MGNILQGVAYNGDEIIWKVDNGEIVFRNNAGFHWETIDFAFSPDGKSFVLSEGKRWRLFKIK